MECHSPEAMSFCGTLDDSKDDGKLPAKMISNLENMKAGSSKHKIDQVLQGTGTLFTDGTGKEDDDNAKQLAKVNKQLGYSFESSSGISEMTSRSGPTLPIQPFPPCCGHEPGSSHYSSQFQEENSSSINWKETRYIQNAVASGKNENKNEYSL